MSDELEVTVQRPVTGVLVVKFPDGTEELATDTHLEAVGYRSKQRAYNAFHDWLWEAVGNTEVRGEVLHGPLQMIRYAAETAIHYSHEMPEWDDEDDTTDGQYQRAVLDAFNQAWAGLEGMEEGARIEVRLITPEGEVVE